MTTVTLQAGATEADIQKALAKLPSGGTLVLPANQTIRISDGLKIDAASRSITLDLNGSTLQQAGDVSVISVNGSMSAATAAKLGHDSSGHVTVSASGLGKMQVGDYVKIVSDDELPNDHGDTTRLGQAMKVIAVNDGKVTLEGELVNGDLYKTNVRVSKFQGGTVEISNGTVRGDQKHESWGDALINVRSTVGTHIDGVTVRDGNSMGINFVNTADALVTQSAAINLTDDTAHGHYGYGVHSASSVNTTVDGFYAEAVRHAVDDNSVGVTAGHKDVSKFGADIGLTATNVVANATTAFAFSWHSEGRLGYYGDSVVFNSEGVVAFRGTDHVAQNISGSGNIRGIQFFEYGDGDGQRNLVENMQLKETVKYVYYNSGADPKNNTIADSVFEMTNLGYKLVSDAAVTVANTIVKGVAAGDESITGTSGDDRLLGGAGTDTISGGAGRDYIWGGTGADRLTGGGGADRFAYLDLGEAGDTIADFGSGDVIDLSAFAYRYGWKGDVLDKGYVRFVTSGSDTLVQVDTNGGGNSFTTLATLSKVKVSALSSASISTAIMVTDYNGTGEQVVSRPGEPEVTTPTPTPAPTPTPTPSTDDTDSGAFADLTGYTTVNGTGRNDSLKGGNSADLILGGAGNDRLYGKGGNDVLVGGAGADFLHGGGGDDTVSYADSASGLVVNLANPSQNTGDAKGDSYSQIRHLTGSEFDDRLYGSDAMNTIRGGAGDDRLLGLGGSDTLFGGAGNDVLEGGEKNDVLNGGDGNDRLIGGEGYDSLTGGAGSDTFVFDRALKNSIATIEDFVHGTDKIALDNTGLSSLSDVTFVNGRSAKAHDSSPTIAYDKASGEVYFDEDGSGWHQAVLLGKVADGHTLTLSDFILL